MLNGETYTFKTIQCNFNENMVSIVGVSKMTISSVIIMFAEHFEVRFITVETGGPTQIV